RDVPTALKTARASAEVEALIRKRAEDWSSLAREADANERIQALAKHLEAASDPAEALKDCAALFASYGGTDTVERHRESLTAIGIGLLEREFDRTHD